MLTLEPGHGVIGIGGSSANRHHRPRFSRPAPSTSSGMIAHLHQHPVFQIKPVPVSPRSISSHILSFEGFNCAHWVIDGYCSFQNFRTICQRSCGVCPTAAPTSAPSVLASAWAYAPAAPELAVGGVPFSVSSRAPNFTFGLQVGSAIRAFERILSRLRSTSSAGEFYLCDL